MSDQLFLFQLPEHVKKDKTNNQSDKPRLVTVCRNQYELVPRLLDNLISKDHLARDVWNYVQNLDLSIVLRKIQSREGHPGRPSTDPKITLSLWLFSTIKGIGSSRVIADYCKEHDAYKWICGGVNVNYHSISDFRTYHGDLLNDLLTQSVAVLSTAGIISLERVSQDGMRVRASAGASSFRKEGTLEMQMVLAKLLLEDINEETKKDPGACRSRLAASERRVSEEKIQKLDLAIKNLHELEENRRAQAKKDRKKFGEKEENKVRASTTDGEARVMKMPCSGFRPAFNVQFASTNKGKAIIGVEVINKGSDSGQAMGMIKQIVKRYGITPDCYLLDKGFDAHLDIDTIDNEFDNCKIYSPVKYKKVTKLDSSNLAKNKNKTKKNKLESPLVQEWEMRMETEEGKKIFKERSATAEFVNAQTRNKGLQQFPVRGLDKVLTVTLLYAIVHNMTIALNIPTLF